MARTDPTDPAPSPGHGEQDSISAAARALADATAALTRMLGKQVQVVGDELNDTIASSLREASRGLADASESVSKHAGRSRAEDRRREKVDRTRADLLAAATRAFARQGYEGASVGDIAADAGYTKGALYAHFGSKNELFLEVARRKIASAPEQACLPPLDADGLEPEVVDASGTPRRGPRSARSTRRASASSPPRSPSAGTPRTTLPPRTTGTPRSPSPASPTSPCWSAPSPAPRTPRPPRPPG
jgi:hypothetical protein